MSSSKQASNKVARSTTPPSLKSVGVREFMRSGMRDLKEPTMVLSHNDEVGVWLPRGQYEALLGANGTYYASSSSITNSTLNSSPMASSTMLRSFSPPAPVDVPGLTKAVEQLHDYLRRLPEASDTTKEEK